MTPPEHVHAPLSEDRFLRFEDKFDQFVAHLAEKELRLEARLTVLETNQSHAAWIATWLSGIVAAVVTAVIVGWKTVWSR